MGEVYVLLCSYLRNLQEVNWRPVNLFVHIQGKIYLRLLLNALWLWVIPLRSLIIINWVQSTPATVVFSVIVWYTCVAIYHESPSKKRRVWQRDLKLRVRKGVVYGWNACCWHRKRHHRLRGLWRHESRNAQTALSHRGALYPVIFLSPSIYLPKFCFMSLLKFLHIYDNIHMRWLLWPKHGYPIPGWSLLVAEYF